MLRAMHNPLVFQTFGIVGVLIVVMGSLVSALVYRGRDSETYSPLNHFISELGEVGVSRFAWLFNISLILAGVALIPASISLGLLLPGWVAKIGMVAGVVCAISLSLVGVFPMNRQKAHGTAAITYFRSGLVMILLFNLAIFLQPEGARVFSRLWGLAGLPAVVSFASFLVLIGQAYKKVADPLATQKVNRPKIWTLAVVEWMIFITVLLWFIMMSIAL